jgi:soluble epoxide hydrolase/lipid-phosphate phosphatase
MHPASFNHRRELLDTGRTYHFVDQLPPNYQPSTPTLLCVHGFPDLWYGWRYQIGPWSTKFRVIVPDMLGYGSTDKPLAPSEYSTRMLSDDLAALLDLVGVEKAVCVLFRPTRLTEIVFVRSSSDMIGVPILSDVSHCGILRDY